MSEDQKEHTAEERASKCFDATQADVIPAKVKRKYTKKVTEIAEVPEVKEEVEMTWYCSTCKENIGDKEVMKIGAGENRSAVFCPMCQRSFGFQDPVVMETVARIIRDNPTGK